MKIVLDLYFQMDTKIKEIEKQILDLINALKPAILTIPSIGYLSAVAILSESVATLASLKTLLKCFPLLV